MIDQKNSEYEIKDTIGKGNFGKVLLAINKKTKEKVAIKIIEKSKMNKYYSSVQIERELSVIGQMNHLNIIKIHKIVSDKKKYEIVMEYCENGELYEYIVNKRKLEEDEAAYYFFQLINGLESIHSKNIVHRDLKPENLLITKENILKIIDFGLCNYHNPEKLLTTPCGSPSYASPEMVSGKEYNGIFVDIWCTGIILYAMLAGYLPFEGNDNFSLFKKIIKCEVEYPSDTPKMALDLMGKILVSDPNERISINEIKKHPFYLKGKKIFGTMHKEYLKELERPIMRKIISSYNSFKGKDAKNPREQNNFFKKKKIEITKKKIKNKKEISPKYFENNDRNLLGRKSVGGTFNKNILCFNIPIINSNDKRLFADEHNNVYKETEIFHKKSIFNLKRNNIDKQIFLTENNHDKDVIKYIKPLLSPRKSHIVKGRKIGEDNYIYNSSKNLNNFEKFNRKKFLDKDSPPPSYKNAPYKRPSLKDLNFCDSFSQRNTIAANKSIKLNDKNINVSSNLSAIRNPFLHRIFNLKKNENNDRNNTLIINSYINNHKSFNSSELKDEKYIYEKKHQILKNSHKDKSKSNNINDFDIYYNMSSAQTSKKQILRNNIFFPNLNKISNENKDKNLYKNTKNEEDNVFKPNYKDFDNKYINSDINSVKTKKKNNCRTISDINSNYKILNNRYNRNKFNQIDKLFNSQEKIFVKKQIESNSIKNNKRKKNTIQTDINSNIFQSDNLSIKKLPIERKKINAVIFNNQINQLNIYKNDNNSYDLNQIFFYDNSHFCKTEENEPNLNQKEQTRKEFNTLIISKANDDENNQFQSISTQKNIIRRKIYPKEDKFKDNNSNYILTSDGKKLNKNKIFKINTSFIPSKKNKEKRYINANNKEKFNKRKINIFVK